MARGNDGLRRLQHRMMVNPPTYVARDETPLYLCDNGALLCENHLGATERVTGRDLSGQKIHRLTDAERAYMVREAGRGECETCGAIPRRATED